ncbi:MAG: hypothetical protein JXQ75_03440 [Phycisphaerae bacterium]|nr:hypothetical protein [Phycisphaerae bacterium]
MPQIGGLGEPTKLRDRLVWLPESEEGEPIADVPASEEKLRSNEILKYESLAAWRLTETARPTREEHSLTLPPALAAVAQAVRDSHSIVEREAEWDEEQAEVLTCSEDTWRHAMEILVLHAKTVWYERGVVVNVPTISAGPEGSVDLYWTAEPYGLLLNVPADADESPSYYGDDRENPDTNRTSGKLKPGAVVDPGVLMWLVHMSPTQA